MIRKPQNLTEEEKHAAQDLALYIVNTRELYGYAQEIMRQLAHRSGHPSDTVSPKWVGHAKRGAQFYEREMGPDDHTAMFHTQHVYQSAAFLIADHYREEAQEIAAEAKGSDA